MNKQLDEDLNHAIEHLSDRARPSQLARGSAALAFFAGSAALAFTASAKKIAKQTFLMTDSTTRTEIAISGRANST